MNIKSIVTAALALLVSTACSGGAKQENIMAKDGKVFTFFKKHANDLKGKTVIPFTTHEGSGLANCVEDVKAAFPDANVQKGFSIYGHEVRTGKAKVEKWINGLK